MIYLLISDSAFFEKLNNEQKRDCRTVRQPLNLLPEEIKAFINDTKNEVTKKERALAYTSLLSGLHLFYDIGDATLKKDQHGKPFLVTKSGEIYLKNDREIHINISHSEGVSAVCISNEGKIGVDIQAEIEAQRAERLEKRFFMNLDLQNKPIDMRIFACDIKDEAASFVEVELDSVGDVDFTAKWAYAESLMKLYGRGFGDLSMVNNEEKCDELSSGKVNLQKIRTNILSYKANKNYTIAVSIM